MTAIQFGWVALGGALGACGRFWLSSWVNKSWTGEFPLGTLTVNVLGSFVFGLLSVVVFEALAERDTLRLALLVGFLGAFTTFSTFSFETVRLIEEGQFLLAASNVVGSCLLCVAGVWIGIVLARAFF